MKADITRQEVEAKLEEEVQELMAIPKKDFPEKVFSTWLSGGVKLVSLFRIVAPHNRQPSQYYGCLTQVKSQFKLIRMPTINRAERALLQGIKNSPLPESPRLIKKSHLRLFKEWQLKFYDHFHPEGAKES